MTLSQSRYGWWIAAAAIAVGLGPMAAEAQQPRGAAPPGIEQQAQIPPQDLKTYAEATREVRRIDEAYRPRLEAAGSPEEQQRIEQQAMAEMVRAVEQEGLSVERFNAISRAAQMNPEVAQQILGHLNPSR